ncbi:hypothetical protein C1645_842303 [Glomus cerebriforme]|uniref:Uncharacterized protein n=1 Tax=Glomus cerebriforme TaxID=658196 RepID=A0A397S1X5_9GLOM|nr:hypothetical protein C1645_842303 [Glomus cerebriforme]
MQLKINKYNDTVYEWIPYNQFNDIKEHKYAYERHNHCKVVLKCLNDSQNIDNEFLNKAKTEYVKDGDCYNWLNKNYNIVGEKYIK